MNINDSKQNKQKQRLGKTCTDSVSRTSTLQPNRSTISREGIPFLSLCSSSLRQQDSRETKATMC